MTYLIAWPRTGWSSRIRMFLNIPWMFRGVARSLSLLCCPPAPLVSLQVPVLREPFALLSRILFRTGPVSDAHHCPLSSAKLLSSKAVFPLRCAVLSTFGCTPPNPTTHPLRRFAVGIPGTCDMRGMFFFAPLYDTSLFLLPLQARQKTHPAQRILPLPLLPPRLSNCPSLLPRGHLSLPPCPSEPSLPTHLVGSQTECHGSAVFSVCFFLLFSLRAPHHFFPSGRAYDVPFPHPPAPTTPSPLNRTTVPLLSRSPFRL